MRPKAIMPTTMFSIVVMRLNLLAGPNEGDHQREKSDGCEDVCNISHVRSLVEKIGGGVPALAFPEIEWFFA